jgi:hypothetical protein
VGPWARPTRQSAAPVDESRQIVFIVASVFVVPIFLTAGVLLARRNIRLGRGDRQGAVVLASIVFSIALLGWLFGSRHVPALFEEQTRLARALASALFAAAVSALLYLAFEPAVRRVWPQMLITWSRLVAGRFRDAFVGRDLLVGGVAGLAETLVTFGAHLLPGWLGLGEFRAAPVNLDALLGPGQLLAGVLTPMRVALDNAVLGAVGLVLIRMVARRPLPTFLLASAIFAPLAAQGQVETGILALDLAVGALLVAIILGVILRFGLFAGMVTFFCHLLTKDLPMTLDGSALYFTTSALAIALVLGMSVLGFVLARANQPLFGRLVDD